MGHKELYELLNDIITLIDQPEKMGDDLLNRIEEAKEYLLTTSDNPEWL
jgi:hypothetical protein